jgi:hypothetical protein
MKRLTLIFALLLTPNLLRAGFLVSTYDEFKNAEAFKNYFTGFGTAFMSANVEVRDRGMKPVFCPSGNLGLNSENYMQVLETAVKHFREAGGEKKSPDTTLELIFMKELLQTFPCESPKP